MPNCSFVDLEKRVRMLKDAAKVESFFFNDGKSQEDNFYEDQNFTQNSDKEEGVVATLQGRVDGDVVDGVFNEIYDTLDELRAEIKAKNEPSPEEKEMMEQMIKKAKEESNQSLEDMDFVSLKKSIKTMCEYINLVEYERLKLFSGIDDGGLESLNEAILKPVEKHFKQFS